ncbi:MAG: Regulatory protein [Verrucomicrobiales bacterium]|nr:Regulatory protein [Verrucomicrobiales bacterium]
MLSKPAWTAIARSCALSPREVQIIRGIFDNHTEHAIAASLGISRHTIHTYLTRIFHKLDATTRTQVVLRIMQRFLFLTAASDKTLRPIRKQSQNAASRSNT